MRPSFALRLDWPSSPFLQRHAGSRRKNQSESRGAEGTKRRAQPSKKKSRSRGQKERMNTAKTNDPRNNQNRRKRGRHGARPEKAQAGFGGLGRGETENRPSRRRARPSTNMNILPRGQSPMKEHRIERSGCLRGKAVNRRRKATLRRAAPKPQARQAFVGEEGRSAEAPSPRRRASRGKAKRFRVSRLGLAAAAPLATTGRIIPRQC